MAQVGVGPGWFSDPDGSGGLRYFDGTTWTDQRAPAPQVPGPPPPWPPYGYGYGYPYAGAAFGRPPWKGAGLGRPAAGPGSLASPGRRLGARALDLLLLLPVFALITGIAIAVVAPHAGPIFPPPNPDPNASGPVPGILWIYLTIIGASLLSGLLLVAYDAVSIGRYGRTLGKRWVHIHVVRTDGSRVLWGRAVGRAALSWAAGFLGWIGLLDPLWCLWDENHQCVHDHATGTIVVND